MERLLKFSILAFALLAFSASIFAELAPISVEREMASEILPGQTMQVKLHVAFIGEKPSGIIITENIPQGWEIKSSIPAATNFEGYSSWLIYGDNVKDSTIVYELKAPADFNDFAVLDGFWETLASSDKIQGTGIINLKKDPAAPQQPQSQTQAQDNALLYAAAGIAVVVVLIIAFVLVSGRKKKPEEKQAQKKK